MKDERKTYLAFFLGGGGGGGGVGTSCKNYTKPNQTVILWLDKGDFPQNLHTVCLLK